MEVQGKGKTEEDIADVLTRKMDVAGPSISFQHLAFLLINFSVL